MLAGMEPIIDGTSVLSGSAGTGCGGGWGGDELPPSGRNLQGQCGKRGEVVAAVPRDRQRGGAEGWRPTALRVGRRARLAADALGRAARRHAAGAPGRAGRARDRGELLRGLALLRARRHQLQKKSLHASEQDRPDVARRRAQWKRYQGRLDPARLVVIDETWAKTNMTRTHGRCARGLRLVAKTPHGRWRTLTFLAALRADRIDAPCVIDGPINRHRLLAYIEQLLVPTLRPGDIIIIDNPASHKGAAVRRVLRAAGAKLFFLPPYS